MASRDYDEKIYKLFEEGKKLGAPGITSLNVPAATGEQPPPALTTSKIDIIALEKEFDKQAKEASRLQQELNTARDNIHKTGLVISDSLKNSITGRPQPTVSQSNLSEPSKLQANTNNNNLNSFHQNNEISVLTNTKIHLENALEDSQAQVEYLSNKIDSMKRSMEEQKERFRLAVEELQAKLHETVAGRKKLIELRQHDMQKQEETIHRLQTTLKELAASNQMQEQALLDAHERMEILENRNQSNERAMTQIRSILGSTASKDAARSKTASLLNSENISELVPELLVDNLERFVTNSTDEADSLRSKLLQLEAELNAAKQAHEADRILANTDAAEVVNNLKAELQKQIEYERSRCKEAEDSLTLLTNQLKESQVDHNTQSRLVLQSREQINDLTRQLEDLRQIHCNEKGDLQSKLVCLEYDVKLINDKNERLNEDNQSYKESLSDLNHRLHQLNSELNSEREMRGNLAIKDADLTKEVQNLRLQVDDKNNEVSRLREIAAQLRGDLNTKVAKEINEAENAQRIKADERISALSHENVGLREDLSRVKASLEAAERQLSDVISERSEAMTMMKEKDKQVERLSSQLSLSDRKLIEATEARKNCDERMKKMQSELNDLTRTSKQSNCDIERWKSVADEKERVVLQLRHQLESKSEMLKASNKQSDDANREGSYLKSKNQDQQEIIERLREDLRSKEEGLNEYEKRMADLVAEKEKIVKDVHVIEKQISSLVEAKRESDDDLKETRTQLSRLIEERDELTKELKSSHQMYREDVEKLGRELKQKRMDLQLFQDAVQNVKQIDGKAAIMASNMQKEVTDKRGLIDSLQTELSNVYDKLEIEHRENKQFKKETSKLQREIDDIKDKNKKTEQELRDRAKSEKGFKLAVERLEIALEKAAERNAAAQSVINRQEAELSKAHIRRNLDLMDKRIPPLPIGVVDERASGGPNTFGRSPVAPNNNMVLQNMMARILATMATSQTRQDDVTQSIPVHVVPASGRQSEARNNLTTEDIYKVLTEVREQLALNSARQKVTSSCDVRDRSKRHKKKQTPFHNESSELPVVFLHSDATSVCSDGATQQSELDDVTLRRSRSQEFLTSSPYKTVGESRSLRPPSPVSLLLAGEDSVHASPSEILDSKLNQFSPIKNQRKRQSGKGDSALKYGKVSEKYVEDAISDNAEELCRQLQNRLEGLSKIGGKLERQNKIEAKLMKKQEEKLKQIRGSGHLWK